MGDASDMRSLLGLNVRDAKVQKWFQERSAEPDIFTDTRADYYRYKGEGIIMVMSKSGKVTRFRLMAEDPGGDGDMAFRQYQGDLPHGLRFSDSQTEVEDALGDERSFYNGGLNVNYKLGEIRVRLGVDGEEGRRIKSVDLELD
jgi:hypothetical protein